MPGKVALVAFDKCRPEECDKDGTCAAIAACPHRLIKQEAPYDTPMFHPSTCQGCSDCARACPLKAIKIVRM
ncbi:4Fe-4S binding protein [Chloroflexota bacterium]